MGNALSTVFQKIAGNPEDEKTAEDALNSLVNIANNRLTIFYERITSPNFDPKTIPLNKVIYKHQFFRCGVSKDSPMGEELKSSLSAFVNGDTAEGLAKLGNSCLDALFASYSSNQSQKTIYAITTGDLGGVSRIDADFYSYEYKSQALTRITKNIVVVSIVISSAKIDDLDFNDVSTIVQTVYTASKKEEKERIRDQIMEAIEKSKGGKKKGKKATLEAIPSSNVLDNMEEDVFDRLNGGVQSEAPELALV